MKTNLNKTFPLLLLACLLLSACAHRMVPVRNLSADTIRLNPLPVSELDIPLQINLRPLYSSLEQSMQIEYTSPGWPDEYETHDCSLQYMYRYRTGELHISSAANTIRLDFPGFYQLKGMERTCKNGKPTGKWSTPCACGFKEGERKMDVGFIMKLGLKEDYSLDAGFDRTVPNIIDQCDSCKWKQDITRIVTDTILTQTGDIEQLLKLKLSTVNLKPRAQELWTFLQKTQVVEKLAFININPEQIRVSPFDIKEDTLNFSVGLSARPIATLQAEKGATDSLPNLRLPKDRSGIDLYIDARLNYDSLSRYVNAQFHNKRYEIKAKGIRRHVIIDSCWFYAADNGVLVTAVKFKGSYRGTAWVKGKPILDTATNTLRLEQFNYALRTNSIVLNLGRTLFNRRIMKELRKYEQISLNPYIDSLLAKFNPQLQKNFGTLLTANGHIQSVQPLDIRALSQFLLLRTRLKGNGKLVVSGVNMSEEDKEQ
jgi:Domain of unknown function (DUF4403)